MKTSLHQPTKLRAKSQFSGSRTRATFIVTAMATALSSGLARGQTAPAKFVPFDEFVQSVKAADGNVFIARPAAKVKASTSFEEMRQHIANLYQGVQVSHSYVLGSQTFDCVPVDQQPTVRILGLSKIAVAPPTSAIAEPPGNGDHSGIPSTLSQLPAGKTEDDFGNALGCEAGTIPMSRVTLEQLSGFQTLHQFFQKSPSGGAIPLDPGKVAPAASSAHKYSFTYRYVNNLGPSTNINLWLPYVYTDEGEIFSLAQLWTIGYSSGPVQTAETGWQNYPALYGNENPNLFIYWTADGYNQTGCYNLSCGAFVQTSSSLHLGAGFSNYSVPDGPQYEIKLQYYLWEGNWWLWVGNGWVGYYPASIYQGGQLSKYSNLLEFGSESVPGYYEGVNVWPAEGSAQFAASGWTYAAYQRLIYNVNTSGTSVWSSLTADVPSPACYTIAGPAYSSSWGEYFYFGGPGGASCQ
jgi:neprosin-like protein